MRRPLARFAPFARLAPLALAAVLAACPAPPSGDDDDGDTAEGEGEGEGEGDFGFPLRTPLTVEVPCETCASGTAEAPQIDHVCTLHVGGRDHIVYVQANPTAQGPFFFAFYEDVLAFAHDNATNETVEVAGAYDYGGNHHNDFFDVTVGPDTFRFNHSSFGFGFRACQPADCVQLLDAGGLVVDDGCTAERTHAESCVLIVDGTLPPLADAFERCLGDPNGS